MTMQSAGRPRANGPLDRALVAIAPLLGLVDFVVWGVAVSLGFGGLGGDRTPTEQAVLNGDIVDVAALVSASLGLLAPVSVFLMSGAKRTKTLLTIVGLQVLGTILILAVVSSS